MEKQGIPLDKIDKIIINAFQANAKAKNDNILSIRLYCKCKKTRNIYSNRHEIMVKKEKK